MVPFGTSIYRMRLPQQVRRHSLVAPLVAANLCAGAYAQAPTAKLDRVIGEVMAIDAAGKRISLKSDAGAVTAATVDESTSYLRIPPGEKDLKKAAKITLPDVAVGDRAFVRGHMAEDQKSIAAVAVIIMTKSDLAQKHERDREEWKRRGMAGPITAINAATKEITISTRTREGPKPVVVEMPDTVNFRRYAPDSVRFSDARPGSFADLKLGDQLRVLGEKNADGTRIKAEEIVSGSFRNIAGVIKSIDAGKGEIKLTDLVEHKPVTVHVTSDTSLKRLAPWMAGMLARRDNGASGSNGGGPAGRAEGVPGPPRAEGAKPGAGGAPAEPAQFPGAGGGPGGGMRRAGDLQDMLERMPQLKLDELKPGDAIMLSATNGADPASVTAINVLAGVEPLLTAAPKGGQQIFGNWNFDIGLPQ